MEPVSADARLSNYRLERLLGQGGMGAVYLARDLTLDRPVAIKFINPERAADPVARQRLLREARAAAALDHPHICVIHEVIDEPGGRAGIVMQYVEGETLASRLRSGPLDVRVALAITADIAAALAAAHRQGIIHRDIKPQNIVLTKDQHAKLLDFGLALQHLPSGSDDDSTQAALTLPGALAGTPAYMSPEQAQGLTLDGRSDLFSLGCVLYECLTGRRPFTGSSPFEVAHQVLSIQPAAPSSLRPELTGNHDELCLRLLAKHRDERFQSADELLGALRVSSSGSSWSRPLTDGGKVPPRKISRRVLLTAASVGLIALVGFVGWWRTGAPAEPSDPQAANWYRIGSEFIRDGAPHSARLALNETIKAAPDFVPAYVRLAEAETELDELERAQETLLRAGSLISGTARLGREDRMRAEAVRALMLRDPDAALRAYQQIANERPDSPEVWLDLGRAQDAFSQSSDAVDSFSRAIEIDDQYAAAHLRRATLLGLEGRGPEALAGFAEAERLFRAASRPEGEVETLLRKGTFLHGAGKLKESREALERALVLAAPVNSLPQQVRARIVLSTVTALEGRWQEAESMAQAAVADALDNHLELVAADALVDLATVLIQRGKIQEADAHLVRASELAEERRAYRIVARAKLQRAYILYASGHSEAAIAAAQWPLEFFRANNYRRLALIALNIVSRAHEHVGQYAEARALAELSLATATAMGAEAHAADALENLGGQANALGDLPSALAYRSRGIEIRRRQNDASRLGFELLNGGDLLVRLGQRREAAPLLDEIDSGIANKLEAFVPRGRRVQSIRLVSAAIERRPSEIRQLASPLVKGPADKPDFSSQLADALLSYADALEGRCPSPTDAPLQGTVMSPLNRELRYWALLTRLLCGDSRTLSGVEETLATDGATVSYEFEWRIAAIGAAAARQMKTPDREGPLAARAGAALNRLLAEWKTHRDTYGARPDLVDLRDRAGLPH